MSQQSIFVYWQNEKTSWQNDLAGRFALKLPNKMKQLAGKMIFPGSEMMSGLQDDLYAQPNHFSSQQNGIVSRKDPSFALRNHFTCSKMKKI